VLHTRRSSLTGVALAKFYGACLAPSRLQLGYYWCPTRAKKVPFVFRTGDFYRNNIGELFLGRVISFLLYKHYSHKISLIGLSSEKKNPQKCALFI